MSVREPTGGVRDWLGGLVSRLADWLLYGEGHYLVLCDAQGGEVFSISIPGGYIATDPVAPYTLLCCEDREVVGIEGTTGTDMSGLFGRDTDHLDRPQ